MAWNWIVNKNRSQRERFAGPLVITGLVVAGLLLLAVLYPEKSLLKLLSAQEVSSPAQRRYLEALIHLRPGDSHLVLVLARSYLAARAPLQVLETLDHLREPQSEDVRKKVRQMRYEALRQQLLALPAGSSEWKRFQPLFAEQIDQLLAQKPTRSEMEKVLADAQGTGDSTSAQKLKALLKPYGDAPPAPKPDNTPAARAAAAIAGRDYRAAARIYFAEMQGSPAARQKRHYFLAGVRALQSGNLVAEALTAGELHINGLAGDRETLLFMARLALAANRPDRSQFYIRRALGMPGHGGAP